MSYTYASGYNRWLLTTVSDNLGNTLQFNHYDGTANPDLKGVISSVTSNNTLTPQVANYNYEIRSITWPKSFFMFSNKPDNVNFGNLASIVKNINGVERVTNFTNYNSLGFPQQLSYPSGIVDNFVYNNEGTLASKTTVSGEKSDVTTYLYDDFKRLVSETDSNGEIRSFAYDLNNQLIKTTLPDGSQINRSYFSNGLIASENVSDIKGNTTTESSIALDENGRPLVIQQGNVSDRNK